jgi:hypothetical protein
MRAIVLEKFGGVDSLVYADLPEGFWMSMVSA